MTYEKDIPDFALVPAREPEERILIPVSSGAVYSSVQVTNITEKPKTVIMLEEDILVPDTRPDLKEVLDITGKIHLASRELDVTGRPEDALSLAGDVEMQILYLPEKQDTFGPVVSIGSRISFREPWHTGAAQGTSLILEAGIEKIECMVVNERKFRVKVSVDIGARECRQQNVDVFEGITGEEIQTLRERVEITNIAQRKRDIMTIREELEPRDGDEDVQNILKQEIAVVENYKQATAEKIVINGFIYVSLLYTCSPQSDPGTVTEELRRGEEAGDRLVMAGADMIRQRQERVEFTQFIPLSQSGQWSGCSTFFDGSDLRVKLAAGEDGGEVLRLEGDIVTWVELYRNTEKEIIVDGYHREKDFVCDFEEAVCRTLVGSTSGDCTVREMISLEHEGLEADRILGVFGETVSGESHAEPGRIVTEGIIMGKLFCRSTGEKGNPVLYAVQQKIPFRCIASASQAAGDEMVAHRIYLKDLWAEKINGKQAELNAAVAVSSEMMRQTPFKVLKNPAFEEVHGTAAGQNRAMAVYIVRPGDTIWSVARHFKSTVDSISQMNQMEDGRLIPGQKLLILR